VEGGAVLKVRSDVLSLDSTDLRILKALQEDARQTYSAIGRLLGVAHSTVYERIKRMEERGVIERYTALVDAERMGVKRISAMMSVYTDPKEIEAVAQKLSESSDVVEVYACISEELLILAKVTAASQEDLHAFIANSVAPLPGVLRIRTSIITKKFKETQQSIDADYRGVRL
jgi:DNA-binding Lrp family transcriptional regulator